MTRADNKASDARPLSTDRPAVEKAAARNARPEGRGGDFSDNAPGLVPPSKLNRGDRGVADDAPASGGQLNFDDDEIYSGRGNGARNGGTAQATGADSAKLGPPAEIFSATNLPSDRMAEGDVDEADSI